MIGPAFRAASWRRRALAIAWSVAVIGFAPSAPAAKPAAEKANSPVVATVANEPVFAAEIDDLLADAPSAQDATGEALQKLQAEALEQLINRRAVYKTLVKQGFHPTDDDTDELLAELKQRLAMQQLDFEDFLRRRSLTESLVRRRLAWDAAWTRYLEQTLTDDALEKYFAEHRREFDGTQLRVSHILLKVENLSDRSAVAATVEQAERLRKDIAAGKLSFPAAAEKYSAGPSRRQGGDLGFISRHGQMAEAFSAAAFRLKKSEISPSVITPFGVHLIQCTDVKPGRETWKSRRRELAEAWTRDHFLELAAAARKQAAVKYTGAAPHFKPGTRELVVPRAK